MTVPQPSIRQPGTTALERLREARLLAPAIATMLAAALLLGLGTWQMQRKAWKETLLAEMATRSAIVPVNPGLRLWSTSADLPPPFTRVTLTGKFLHDKERYWFADGRLGSGFHEFTPLLLDTAAPQDRPPYIVWVNRGYVPARLKDPATRVEGQTVGSTQVVGVIRAVGERNNFTPPNDIARNVWFWRDLSALDASADFTSATANVAPVMIDVEPAPPNPGGWPEGQSGDIKLPNRHLEYALTWYGLAATVIGVFLAFGRGRLARPRE